VSPVLLLFAAGLIFMWRRRELRPELWLCLAVVVLYFVMDAARPVDSNGWSGGWSIASRHLTPMLPFMVFPLAFGLHHRLFRAAFLALGAVSVVIMFMAVSSGDQFAYGDHNPLVNEMLFKFFHGRLMTNWGNLIGQLGLRALAPFGLLAGCLTARLAWLFWNVREPGFPRAAPATPTVGSPSAETAQRAG
jgi:hypothetical protein